MLNIVCFSKSSSYTFIAKLILDTAFGDVVIEDVKLVLCKGFTVLRFCQLVLCFVVGLCGFLPLFPRTVMKSKRNRAAAARKQAELDQQNCNEQAELAEPNSNEQTNTDKDLNLPQS